MSQNTEKSEGHPEVESDAKAEPGRLWGGRFASPKTHPCLDKINNSIGVDHRLHLQDLKGSMAYATALLEAAVLSENERNLILAGLKKIEQEWRDDEFVVYHSDEDIHTAIERRLKEMIGSVAGKLHTGRSRNDQVATDTRLWLKHALDKIDSDLAAVIMRMAKRAEEELDVLMPGFTHLQKAQPVRWSHWLLSHAWALHDDRQRLRQIAARTVERCPLGSGALAGTPLHLDRTKMAAALGFDAPAENSMHAVADRDFIAEFLFWAALSGVHLSRLAEDLILHCTLGFTRMGTGLSTGSSLMPHKSNPDGVELVRATSATLIGQCTSMLTLLKGLPSTYNKDLQLDKGVLFQAHDDFKLALDLVLAVVDTLQVERARCEAALEPAMLATDLAYYLVRKGMPFREAHGVVGGVVRLAELIRVPLDKVTLEDLKSVSSLFDEDVANVWSFESSVEQYQSTGGTSRIRVEEQIAKLKLLSHME